MQREIQSKGILYALWLACVAFITRLVSFKEIPSNVHGPPDTYSLAPHIPVLLRYAVLHYPLIPFINPTKAQPTSTAFQKASV